MATRLLEQTFIKYFKDSEISYSELEDDIIEALLPIEEVGGSKTLKRALVTDYKREEPYSITITVLDVVSFTAEEEYRGLRLVNSLNKNAIGGRFTLRCDYGISYYMQGTLNGDSGADDARNLIVSVLAALTGAYPLIHQVKWAESAASVDRILSSYESESYEGENLSPL